MRIVFIGLNLFTFGGIQRVVCTLCNELCINNKVTVLMPISETCENIFGLNEKVKIDDLYKLVNANLNLNSIGKKLLLKINRKTGLMKGKMFSGILSNCLLDKKSEMRLAEYINTNQFDLVVSLEELYSFYVGRVSQRIKAKTIGWMHDTYNSYFELKGKHSFGMENIILSEIKKLNALITLTNYDNSVFAKKMSIPIYTLYNPVPFKDRLDAKPHDGKNIVFVGRIVDSHKGLSHLLRIVNILSTMRNDVMLTIVGDGPDFKSIEQMIIKHGMTAFVKMVGNTSQVEQYYAYADAFLHTSNYEGFGVVIVEAMSYGIPVIAFENIGPNEIIHHGTDGFLIPKYDYERFAQCVNDILNNTEKWEKISLAARRRSEDFSIDNFVRNATKIFDTVINN